MAEPRLGLVRADLSLTRPTPVTAPTPVHERHRDAVPNRERRHVGTGFPDNSRELVTRHVRQRNQLVAAPGMLVRSTNPRCPHINHGTVGWTLWRRQLRDAQRRTNGVEDNSTHSPVLPADAAPVGCSGRRFGSGQAWWHVFRRVPARRMTGRYAAAWATDYSCVRSSSRPDGARTPTVQRRMLHCQPMPRMTPCRRRTCPSTDR